MARRPSGWLYVVAILILFGGCGASIYSGFRAFPAIAEEVAAFPRGLFPGEAEMELPAGDLTLFAETKSEIDGAVFLAPADAVNDLRCKLAGADGTPVAIEVGGMNEQYSFGGYEARSLGHLTTPAAGRYRLTCTGAEGSRAVLSIGSLGFLELFLRIGGPALAGFLLGIGMIVTVFFMRRR